MGNGRRGRGDNNRRGRRWEKAVERMGGGGKIGGGGNEGRRSKEMGREE